MDSNHNLNIQIQNRLIEELTYSNSELKLINSFAKIIQELKSTKEVVNEVIKKFESHHSYNYCTIYLLNESKLELFRYGTSIKFLGDNNISYINDVIIGNVVKTRRSQIRNDLEDSHDDLYKNFIYLSQITIPMLNKDNEIVGVIDFIHPKANVFKHSNLETLTTIATVAANKIIETKYFDKINKYQKQLEDYVHIVSHDLKAPLRSINALIYWIKEDNKHKLNDTTLENLSLIDEILLQMENLISSTLNYSKMDYEVSEKVNIDLNQVIEDVQKTVFNPKNISFIINKQLPIFYGEKVKIFQLFQNLISNAVKYNDKDKGEIVIDFEEDLAHYQFSIMDNGMGIHQRYFKKIFEVFQSLNVDKESSGIGLSIVKKIVHYFNGEIWLESTEGIGTTFYFTLKKKIN